MLSNTELEVFKQQKRTDFIDQLVPYFQAKDPFHTQAIGEKGLRQVIQLGIDNARQYGLTRESPVRLYVHLMLYLGSHFDTDPLLPWVHKALTTHQSSKTQSERTNTLRRHFLTYVEKTCGSQGEHLQNFMRACEAQMKNPVGILTNDQIISFIQHHYPKKYTNIGEDLLRKLIIHSQNLCDQHRLSKKPSCLILVCLRLIYGTEVMNDPLFLWIQKFFMKSDQKKDQDALFAKITAKFLGEVTKHVKEEY